MISGLDLVDETFSMGYVAYVVLNMVLLAFGSANFVWSLTTACFEGICRAHQPSLQIEPSTEYIRSENHE
jgi:hypothetical protein